MPKGIGPGDYVLDESGRDIAPRAKRRLSDYLSTRTRGGAETFTPPEQGGGTYTYMPPRPNAFPVDEGVTEISADASRLSPGSFAPDLRTPVTDPDLRDVVRVEPSAERSVNGGVSGHEAVNSQLARSAAGSVLSSNRFTAGGKFTSRRFGGAVPEAPNFTGQGSNTGRDVFESMRKAALASMLNAAGGVAGAGGGLVNMSDIDGTSADDFKGGFAGLPRIGVPGSPGGINDELRVRTDALRPAADRSGIASGSPLTFEGGTPGDDQAADISPRVAFDQSDIAGASPTRYNARTYGQLNSYLQNFSGAGTLNAAVLAVLAYGVLFIASAVVSFVISLIVNRMPRPDPQTDELPLGAERGADFGNSLFGSFGADATFKVFFQNIGGLIAKILGVMQPYDGDIGIFQYFLAATEGSLAILGIDTRNGRTIADALLNISMSPGFYLTLVREIARDLALLVDVNATESGFMGVLQAFRSAKIVRFVDVCARLGIVNGKSQDEDTSMDPDRPVDQAYPPGGDPTSPLGSLNNTERTAQLRVSRSRETTGSKRLAWSHQSLGYTRTELVTQGLIKSLGRQETSLEGRETGLSSLRNLRSRKIASDTGRISPDDREYHETLLDAEYMPFYIHDVRTNEILSFHAFLSQLTDSYSANYTSVDGFGRMDPVQIYKNTTRSISFTFVIVSTSPDDHSQMWYSVNKLVNMVYPQWSEGDRISVGNNTYTQPFSQTVAASPMVRVRIGDVIHSNYSRFALERIFGLEQPDSKLQNENEEAGKNLYEDPFDSLRDDGDYKKIYDATLPAGAGQTPAQIKTKLYDNLNEVPDQSVGNDLISLLGANLRAGISAPVPVKVKVGGRYKMSSEISPITSDLIDPRRKKLTSASPVAGKIVKYSGRNKIDSPKANVIVELESPITVNRRFGNETYEFKYLEASIEDLEMEAVFSPPLPPLFSIAGAPTLTKINDFLDPQNNPVVRSFEEGSGGRGLAGFIQSLGLEYGDTENTWTVERGSRAPNMVRVSVTFLPIHDIPLGLSSDGTSRAAAYPVGNLVRKRHFPQLAIADARAIQLLKGKPQ